MTHEECLLGCWNFEVFIACLVSPLENILIHWYGQWHRATVEEKPAKKKHSEWKRRRRRRLYFSSFNLEVFDRDIRQSMGDFWVTSLTSTISPNQIILTVKRSKYIKVSNQNDYIQIRQQSIKYHQLLLDQDQTTIRQYPSKMNATLLLPIFTGCYLWSIRASPMVIPTKSQGPYIGLLPELDMFKGNSPFGCDGNFRARGNSICWSLIGTTQSHTNLGPQIFEHHFGHMISMGWRENN